MSHKSHQIQSFLIFVNIFFFLDFQYLRTGMFTQRMFSTRSTGPTKRFTLPRPTVKCKLFIPGVFKLLLGERKLPTPNLWLNLFLNGVLLHFRSYPVFAMGGSYTPGSGPYYAPGNTTAVTYTQVTSTGQNIIAGNTYLIQPGVDAEAAPQAIIPARNAPDTVSAVSFLKIKMLV